MVSRKIGLWVALTLLGGQAVVAAANGELTSLVNSVVGRNPGIQAAQSQAAAARAAQREARARSFPQLRAESVLTRGDNPVYAFGTLLQQRSFEARFFDVGFLNHPGYFTDIRSSLEIGMPLFTGFALQNGRRLASLGARQAEQQADGASQGTRFRVVSAYLTALLKQRQLSAVNARIADAAQEVDEANRLKSKGLVLGSDYYAAEAILEGLKAWRAQFNMELEAAMSQIAVLSGQAASLSFQYSLTPSTYSLPSDDDMVKEALRSRSDVQSAALQAESAGAARRLENASALPSVEAFASLATHTEDFSKNPSDRMAGLRASLAFGDPTYFARRARADSTYQAGLANHANAEEVARIEIMQAVAGYKGACESLEPAGRALERARKSLELFRPLYREGRQSILDVLRAEEGLARAETNYLEVLYRLHAGYAQLLLAAGRMDAAAVAEIERHLEAAK